MGNSIDLSQHQTIEENEERDIFISLLSITKVNAESVFSYDVFNFTVKYKRFRWEISRRYKELVALDKQLRKKFPDPNGKLFQLLRPSEFKTFFSSANNSDPKFIQERGRLMHKYIQGICDIAVIFETSIDLRKFLEISLMSCNPDSGRKGKEGYLSKCSGGFIEKYSMRPGDFLKFWRRRWVVLNDNSITWYMSAGHRKQTGCLLLDKGFYFMVANRLIVVMTENRKLLLNASSRREAMEWSNALTTFYENSPRTTLNNFSSSFPNRIGCDAHVYTFTKDYYNAVAVALLGAQKEIFITSWKNSPTTILTRPPLPPLRLDQILKYKADKGVQIFVLLYKEVENIGQGNESGPARSYLQSLSPNIRCIRHPNKFIGGSTAVLWSHHEKTVTIDRNLSFIGGVDLAFTRYDDGLHRVVDEEGVLYPGKDYRQPAPGLFKPARPLDMDSCARQINGEDFFGDELNSKGSSKKSNTNTRRASATEVDDNAPVMATATTVGEDAFIAEAVVDLSIRSHSATPTDVPRRTAGAKNHTPPMDVIHEERPASLSQDIAVEVEEGGERMQEGASASDINAIGVHVDIHIDIDSDSGDEQEADNGPATGDTAEQTAMDTKLFRQVTSTQQGDEDHLSLAESDDPQDEEVGRCRSEFSSSASECQSDTSRTTKSSFSNMISSMFEGSKTTMTPSLSGGGNIEFRDHFPRMGWHDLQAAVNGQPARDIASHFVQRWNHHRLSTSSFSEPILSDITDNLRFTVCAKCDMTGILETLSVCPACGYDLGSINSFSRPFDSSLCPIDPDPTPIRSSTVHTKDDAKSAFVTTPIAAVTSSASNISEASSSVSIPISSADASSSCTNVPVHSLDLVIGVDHDCKPSADSPPSSSSRPNSPNLYRTLGPAAVYSYIVFECSHRGKLPFKIQGDCPVVVTEAVTPGALDLKLENLRNVHRSTVEESGIIVELAGSTAETHVLSMNLYPQAGDVILAVDNTVVTHLNSAELRRFLNHRKFTKVLDDSKKHRSNGCVEESDQNQPIRITYRRHYLEEHHESLVPKAISEWSTSPQSSQSPYTSPISQSGVVDAVGVGVGGVGGDVALLSPLPSSSFSPLISPSSSLPPDSQSSTNPVFVPFSPQESATSSDIAIATSFNEKDQSPVPPSEIEETSEVSVDGDREDKTNASQNMTARLYDVVNIMSDGLSTKDVDPICQLAAQREISLAMSMLFHRPNSTLPMVNRISSCTGSKHVQVLRSCGKWSLGIKTECSIMNCWIETIRHSEKVIYIENQFFVGNLAGEGVLNGVPAAICDRIVRAFQEQTPLRVVVIIPMHPNGDYINAKKSKVVLHYQSSTINKCKTSLFSQLAKRAPGIVISDYIGIYSLRNWGILNGKVYSEQVYVHDKLLIVDDRVVVVGSANINDRSMLGSRDTEMAIRIEDSKLMQVTMGKTPYVVGTLPHNLRVNLMRQHLADVTADVGDLLDNKKYRDSWAAIAVGNSAVYDELDGNTSMYRITRSDQFARAYASYLPKSAADPLVNESLKEIKGFIVEYPQNLLGDENNAPSLAVRAIVPNELWV